MRISDAVVAEIFAFVRSLSIFDKGSDSSWMSSTIMYDLF